MFVSEHSTSLIGIYGINNTKHVSNHSLVSDCLLFKNRSRVWASHILEMIYDNYCMGRKQEGDSQLSFSLPYITNKIVL